MPLSRTQLLLVELLCLLVEGGALLDDGEALDVQCLPGCAACCDPWGLLSLGGFLLGYNLAALVLDKVSLGETRAGLAGLACKYVALCQASANFLHRLHSLHGLHRLHGLHCLHGCHG